VMSAVVSAVGVRECGSAGVQWECGSAGR
jgi:hypothetical protein